MSRRNRRPPSPAAMVAVGIAGVVAGVLIFVAAGALIGSGKATSKLGDDTFVIPHAGSLAAKADKHPLLFQDLLNRTQDIWVVHLAGSEWRAFQAHAPDQPRRCQVRWESGPRHFRDPCTGAAYPADGTGLPQYATRVDEKDKLVIDLRDLRR